MVARLTESAFAIADRLTTHAALGVASVVEVRRDASARRLDVRRAVAAATASPGRGRPVPLRNFGAGLADLLDAAADAAAA